MLAPMLTPGQVRDLLAPRAQALAFGPTPMPDVLASLPDDAARRLASGSLATRDVAMVLPTDMLASLVGDALKDAADGRAVSDTDKERAQAAFIAEIAAVLPEPVVRLALSAAAPKEGLARTRTDLLAELLPQLARFGHVEEALGLIGERLHGPEAARALTLTASYLTEAQLDEAIEIVTHAISDYETDYRSDALTGLAPFLNKRQLRRSLSLTVALGDREDMIAALSTSAEMLAVLRIIDGAQAALDGIPDPYSRAVAAAACAEVVEPARARVTARGWPGRMLGYQRRAGQGQSPGRPRPAVRAAGAHARGGCPDGSTCRVEGLAPADTRLAHSGRRPA